MAKPSKPFNFTLPPTPAKTSTTRKLSYDTLRALWINAGGDPNVASTMAAIALAESNGTIASVSPKNTDGTIDRGLWQINSSHGYNNNKLVGNPLYNARAAVAVYNSQGPTAWTTYNNGAYKAFYRASTPTEKSAAKTQQAQTDAANKALQAARTQGKVAQAKADANSSLEQERVQAAITAKQLELTAHESDPWITVTRDSKGNITGFGNPAYGANPPKNVLLIGGQPATNSLYQLQWSNTYATIYEQFTGKPATVAEQAAILASPVSTYTFQQQLAAQPGFTSSPIYKAHAAGIADQAKTVLGKAPPATFVRDAIAQNWDSAELSANLKQLPGYQKGPVFQQALDQAKTVYSSIYGTNPNPEHEAWLSNAITNGWSQDEITAKLRADPAYTSSPEFASKAYSLLTSLGLPTTAPTPIGPLPKTPPNVVAPGTMPQPEKPPYSAPVAAPPTAPAPLPTQAARAA